MTNSPEKKIYRLKGFVPGLLEVGGLAFLGGSNGDEEEFLLLWIL